MSGPDNATPAADDFVARDREETDACEAGTPGCSVDHTRAGLDSECAPW